MHWMSWSGGWMMILWWGVIIAAIYIVVRALTQQKGGASSDESPLDVLKKRYARGEISKEEFSEKKKDIL